MKGQHPKLIAALNAVARKADSIAIRVEDGADLMALLSREAHDLNGLAMDACTEIFNEAAKLNARLAREVSRIQPEGRAA